MDLLWFWHCLWAPTLSKKAQINPSKEPLSRRCWGSTAPWAPGEGTLLLLSGTEGRIKLDSLLPSERHNKPVTREMQTLSFCWKTVFTWCYFQCWKCKGLFCVFYAKQVEINITLHLAPSSWTEKTYRTRNIFISEYFLEGKIKHLSQAPGLGTG